ncbi:hypothetical protein [Actinoallomurus rhizosphaericola]|uniref:hypothetical protein n=1 Tax=Actinoallomurus rhizosphaericola TaxID=2952536 RepID=UPI002093D5A9|nr:hypothetical protein [Actinoallomurus rhizosphaericola]MCO5994813.1 hypothetical protein [Actinoallomurus rhizosphaericola]
MRISRTQSAGMAFAAMTTAVLALAGGAAAAAGVRQETGGICQSVAGINAYARDNGFTPRYVAEMCNRNAGTHWNPADFAG